MIAKLRARGYCVEVCWSAKEAIRGFSGLADAMCSGLLPGPYARIHSQEEGSGSRDGKSERFGTDGRLADTNSDGCKTRIITAATVGQGNTAFANGGIDTASPLNGFWRDADWLLCRDGKWRPVEPGTFPLAHGSPARVGRLRGYDNGIVPQVAQAFIETVMESAQGEV